MSEKDLVSGTYKDHAKFNNKKFRIFNQKIQEVSFHQQGYTNGKQTHEKTTTLPDICKLKAK